MATLKKSLSIAAGSAFAAGMMSAPAIQADSNPFAMSSIEGGYKVADGHMEGKCGGMKKEEKEGQCGAQQKAQKEGQCGGAKANEKSEREGKCGAQQKAQKEGQCGGMKPTDKTMPEGKCGEGKCGSNM